MNKYKEGDLVWVKLKMSSSDNKWDKKWVPGTVVSYGHNFNISIRLDIPNDVLFKDLGFSIAEHSDKRVCIERHSKEIYEYISSRNPMFGGKDKPKS